jgi:hypothetical protein
MIEIDAGLRFKDAEQLRQHVRALPAIRNRIFEPAELKLVSAYAEHVPAEPGDRLDALIRATAESVTVVSPSRPPREPSPFDARIEQREKALETATRALEAARENLVRVEAETTLQLRRAEAAVQHPGDQYALEELRAECWQAVQDAELAERAADEAWLRCSSGLLALRLTSDRWRSNLENARTALR